MSLTSDRASMTVVVPLPPSYRGGTEEYAYRLAQRFSQTRPVRVLTTTVRWKPEAPLLDAGSASVERLAAREIFERPLLIAPGARRHLREQIEASAVLQLHMPFPLVETAAVRAAVRAGIPSVLTYHMDADLGGAHAFPGSDAITGAYRTFSAHPALDACDAVVSNSLGYAQASPVLSRHLGKVHVIRKGVDVTRLGLYQRRRDSRPRPSIVPARAMPPGRGRLLFLGRLVPYKGIPVLLEAVRHLRDAGRDVGLLIAGKGPEEARLRALAQQLQLSDRVTFLGFVPDTDVGPLYRYADVVVAPSISPLESTATTLEEASMCGTAVVGTSLQGAAETIPNDGIRGLLATPGDPDELATAIDEMLDAGRPESPMPLRTWDDTAREYLALFRDLGVGFPRAPVGRRVPAIPGPFGSESPGFGRLFRSWGAPLLGRHSYRPGRSQRRSWLHRGPGTR